MSLLLRTRLVGVFFALGVLAGPLAASAGAQQQAPLPQSISELIRVKDDVYAFRYLNHVSLFVPTDEGVVVVDPIGGGGNPKAPAVLAEAIRSVTDQPVTWLVYSHSAADHTTGGVVFAETATFVSHANAQPRIAARDDPTSPVPNVTFDDMMTLELGGKIFELHRVGLTPEDDYLAFYYPAQKVLMTVDVARIRTIAFGELQAAPSSMMAFLERADRSFDFDVFLSGHGPQANVLGTRQDFRDHRQYYVDLVEAIQRARTGGLAENSPEMVEAVRGELTARYGTWVGFQTGVAGNIRGVLRRGGV